MRKNQTLYYQPGYFPQLFERIFKSERFNGGAVYVSMTQAPAGGDRDTNSLSLVPAEDQGPERPEKTPFLEVLASEAVSTKLGIEHRALVGEVRDSDIVIIRASETELVEYSPYYTTYRFFGESFLDEFQSEVKKLAIGEGILLRRVHVPGSKVPIDSQEILQGFSTLRQSGHTVHRDVIYAVLAEMMKIHTEQ